jgi:L-cysteine desulfidase
MSFFYENEYLNILKQELVPAIGCTEPISIALAGAKAKNLLGCIPDLVNVFCCGSLIKNIKCAVVPNTNQLVGIEASVLAGIVGGNEALGLEVLSELNDSHLIDIQLLLKKDIVKVNYLETPLNLHFMVEVIKDDQKIMIEVKNQHTNVTKIKVNDDTIYENNQVSKKGVDALEHYDLLTFDAILDFVDQVDYKKIKKIIEPQVIYNMAIAEKGLEGNYGVAIGKMIMERNPSLYGKLKAYTASASEARMCGCELPVVTNSGSGNQGIASSVPVIIYAIEKGYPEESMYRALALSNLLTIYQKGFIGRLSAFCGAISACCSSGAALTYLEKGSRDQIKMTVINVLADSPGIICDGAKASCGCKIATGLEAALIGHFLGMEHKSYLAYSGLIRQNVDETISAIGRLASEGMKDTNKTILDIIMESSSIK